MPEEIPYKSIFSARVSSTTSYIEFFKKSQCNKSNIIILRQSGKYLFLCGEAASIKQIAAEPQQKYVY